MEKINLQVYSIIHDLYDDFKGTLEKIAKMGYDGVEFCAYYGEMSGEELNEFLQYIGLEMVANHISFDQLIDEEKFEYHMEIMEKCGCMYAVIPGVHPTDEEDAIKIGRQIEKIAEKCARRGVLLSYHTHGFDFDCKAEDGTAFFDIMMEQAELCLAELDVYWIKFAREDIEGYLRRYAGKINLIHLRQMNAKDNNVSKGLDDGIIDIKKVIEVAKKFGTETFIVEQQPSDTALSEVEDSIKFLKKINA